MKTDSVFKIQYTLINQLRDDLLEQADALEQVIQ